MAESQQPDAAEARLLEFAARQYPGAAFGVLFELPPPRSFSEVMGPVQRQFGPELRRLGIAGPAALAFGQGAGAALLPASAGERGAGALAAWLAEEHGLAGVRLLRVGGASEC